MDFFGEVGLLGVASRLKATSDRFYAMADEVYARHGIALQSRWFPLLRLLHDHGPQTIGDIAGAIGQTHSAVSQLAARLVREGWLQAESDERDRRKTRLDLTGRARETLRRAAPVWRAMRDEIEAQCAAAGIDPWHTLDGLDRALSGPMSDAVGARVRQMRRATVEIVPFRPEYRDDFYRLNADWLRKYFYLEEVDHRVLSHPEAEILAGGGAVVFARVGGQVVGTCALMQASPGEFELTKMAVDPAAQGGGVGRQLLEAMIAEFERRDGRTLFLETNTKLAAAIHLYEALGFERQAQPRAGSHYQRADTYMIWRGRGARAGQEAARAL